MRAPLTVEFKTEAALPLLQLQLPKEWPLIRVITCILLIAMVALSERQYTHRKPSPRMLEPAVLDFLVTGGLQQVLE